MGELSHADHRALLAVLPELYAETDASRLPRTILSVLHRVVPCDSAACNAFYFTSGQAEVVHDHGPEGDRLLPVLAELMSEHPLVVHLQPNWQQGAARLSEIVSRREVRDQPIGREFFHPLGIHDQIGLFIEEKNQVAVALSVQKRGENFTTAARDLLSCLQPHLIQAWRNANLVTTLRGQANGLSSVTEACRYGVVALDAELRVEWMTEFARKHLEHLLDGDPLSGKRLPGKVERWLRSVMLSCKTQALAEARAPLHVQTQDGTLTLQWLPRTGAGAWLMLVPAPKQVGAEELLDLGLTKREAETLAWIMEGKTNGEIAVLLGCRPNTVRKHVEHILNKLRVETRGAAARQAWALLRQR